jgi:glycosyltransferase involved in cell wall biosynthesis
MVSTVEAGRATEPAMRVLHLSHTSQRGGAELALERLLARSRPWSAGLCAPPGGDAFGGLARHGVRLELALPNLPTGGTRSADPLLAARYLTALYACARVLRRSPLLRDADLLHTNTAAAAIFGALASRGTRIPLVVHVRDLVTPESLGRFGFRAFTRIALPHAAGVIANSRSTLRSAEPWLTPGVPRTVLQSPVGVTRRIPGAPVGREVRRIGMLGRLQRWKGQHVFLHAFARAFAGTEVQAYLGGAPLFGETAYADELRGLAARLGIAERVTFLGHVDDVAEFLDSVDVLVHASIRPEPMGQAVIQGLVRGKPVIATEGGGPGEWIRTGVNGLLVAPDQPDALAAAMRLLADSAELRSDLATAAAGTPGVLGDDECVTAHEAFFREVRRARRPAGRGRVR